MAFNSADMISRNQRGVGVGAGLTAALGASLFDFAFKSHATLHILSAFAVTPYLAYRTGLVIVSIFAYWLVSRHLDGSFDLSMHGAFAILVTFQTLYILNGRATRMGDLGSDYLGRSASAGGFLAIVFFIAFGAYFGDQIDKGISNGYYWGLVGGLFLIPVLFFHWGVRNAVNCYTNQYVLAGHDLTDNDRAEFFIQTLRKAKCTFFSHIRGLFFFSLPLTAAWGVWSGEIFN